MSRSFRLCGSVAPYDNMVAVLPYLPGLMGGLMAYPGAAAVRAVVRQGDGPEQPAEGATGGCRRYHCWQGAPPAHMPTLKEVYYRCCATRGKSIG